MSGVRRAQLLAVVCLAGTLGCDEPFGEGLETEPGPGSESWARDELACSSEDDCSEGEGCYDGICQPEQCKNPETSSRSPLGPAHEFVGDLEIAVGGQGGLEFFAPRASPAQLDRDGIGAAPGLIDLVAGRPDASGRPAVATIAAGRARWSFAGGGELEIDLPMVAERATAADVDGDGMDDIVLVSSTGTVAVCFSDGECDTLANLGKAPLGISAGWLGDSLGVVVASDSAMHRVDVDGVVRGTAFDDAVALTSADLDGDSIVEIIAVHDPLWPVGEHRLAVYRWTEGAMVELSRLSIDKVHDVAAADIDGDLVPEIVLLTEDGEIGVVRTEGFALVQETQTAVQTTAEHLALYDRDDDSARATLVEGPTLVTGNPVPMLVVELPPYNRDHSDGVSKVSLGRSTATNEAESAAVSLDLGVELGVSVGGEGLLSGGFRTRIAQRLRQGTTVGRFRSVGSYLSVRAQPADFGDRYGAVLLGTGCYDLYTYRVRDPKARTDFDGEALVVAVPVGGRTSLWSTPRYNQLAELRGDLPVIDIGSRLGNPSSYPSAPSRLDGGPIAAEDMVFSKLLSFVVSDVAAIGWNMGHTERSGSSESAKISLSGKATIGLAGFKVGVNAGVQSESSHSLTVEDSLMVRGETPPIPDDPKTPEDEYSTFAFRFTPVLYRHHYVTETGEEAGFYALTYVVATPAP